MANAMLSSSIPSCQFNIRRNSPIGSPRAASISQPFTSRMATAIISLVCSSRFPDGRAFATASTVAAMQKEIQPDYLKSFWERCFPGQVPSELALPEVLEGDTLYLEGEELKVVQLGHTDTLDTTALYVPSV